MRANDLFPITHDEGSIEILCQSLNEFLMSTETIDIAIIQTSQIVFGITHIGQTVGVSGKFVLQQAIEFIKNNSIRALKFESFSGKQTMTSQQLLRIVSQFQLLKQQNNITNKRNSTSLSHNNNNNNTLNKENNNNNNNTHNNDSVSYYNNNNNNNENILKPMSTSSVNKIKRWKFDPDDPEFLNVVAIIQSPVFREKNEQKYLNWAIFKFVDSTNNTKDNPCKTLKVEHKGKNGIAGLFVCVFCFVFSFRFINHCCHLVCVCVCVCVCVTPRKQKTNKKNRNCNGQKKRVT